jgi:hypothetical protein
VYGNRTIGIDDPGMVALNLMLDALGVPIERTHLSNRPAGHA